MNNNCQSTKHINDNIQQIRSSSLRFVGIILEFIATCKESHYSSK